MQPPDFADRNIGTGRIVGIGQEDDLGRLGHRPEDLVDIGCQTIRIGNRHRRRSGGQDLDLVDQEPVLGEHSLIARREIGLAQQPEQFVRAVAAQDVAGIEAMRPAIASRRTCADPSG
jgi:hypothetical protein